MTKREISHRYLRTEEAARYLGIHPNTLRRLAHAGEIPYIPGNGLRSPWLFDIRDLDAWIEKRKKNHVKMAG